MTGSGVQRERWRAEGPSAEPGVHPLGKLGEVDDHSFVRADAYLLGSIHGADFELDMPALDLGDLRLACDTPPCRRRSQMANVDARAERAFAGVEIRLDRVQRRI